MSSTAVPREMSTAARLRSRGARHLVVVAFGLVALVVLWQIGTWALTLQPETAAFGDFGPVPTFTEAFPVLWQEGKLQAAIGSSLYRLGYGLGLAILIGVPLGIFIGEFRRFRELSYSPFQFIRMISPLAWMPLAVLVFPVWDQAIIFLIVIASVWPVAYATAAGLAKVDPAWFKVARNLGAKPRHILMQLILPAIAFDILSGFRLALGVAWVVLVPAELLGVTSGLGYAIKDARETLSYHHLTAMVLTIGVIGYFLDTIIVMLISRFSWHHRKANA